MTNEQASEKISALREAHWFRVVRTDEDASLGLLHVAAEFEGGLKAILTFKESAPVAGISESGEEK